MRRSPLGLRGLKYIKAFIVSKIGSRSPLGLRGLKYYSIQNVHLSILSRSPLGLRGLKFTSSLPENTEKAPSQPTRAAWIEIYARCSFMLFI